MDVNEQNKITENNKKIEILLKENELIFRNSGFIPPSTNFSLETTKKISIPSEYIRVSKYFVSKYHLNDICYSPNTVKNIAYSLQMSDFYNYLMNRFNIWGSVETMLYKHAIINLVSIIEAIIFESVNNICSPSNCINISNCSKHFSKKQRGNSLEALIKLNQLKITQFSDEEIQKIRKIVELRNRIHIRLAKGNEFVSSEFNVQIHNEVIVFLNKLCDGIHQSGIHYYKKCN